LRWIWKVGRIKGRIRERIDEGLEDEGKSIEFRGRVWVIEDGGGGG
jgi:hypothetical protein